MKSFFSFDSTSKELINRAKESYQKDQEEISNKIKDLGLENDLINIEIIKTDSINYS